MSKIESFFPKSHRIARVDDRRVITGIIYVLKNSLQWKGSPKAYGPHKMLYNRFQRWTELGVVDGIFSYLSAEVPGPLMICKQTTAGQQMQPI